MDPCSWSACSLCLSLRCCASSAFCSQNTASRTYSPRAALVCGSSGCCLLLHIAFAHARGTRHAAGITSRAFGSTAATAVLHGITPYARGLPHLYTVIAVLPTTWITRTYVHGYFAAPLPLPVPLHAQSHRAGCVYHTCGARTCFRAPSTLQHCCGYILDRFLRRAPPTTTTLPHPTVHRVPLPRFTTTLPLAAPTLHSSHLV